jgi:hypothetical protein
VKTINELRRSSRLGSIVVDHRKWTSIAMFLKGYVNKVRHSPAERNEVRYSDAFVIDCVPDPHGERVGEDSTA